jgi:hypothetical protein
MDGELYVTLAPSPAHQRMAKRLYERLAAHFEGRGLGEVFFAPIDLILTNHDVVQPDLVASRAAQHGRRAASAMRSVDTTTRSARRQAGHR